MIIGKDFLPGWLIMCVHTSDTRTHLFSVFTESYGTYDQKETEFIILFVSFWGTVTIVFKLFFSMVLLFRYTWEWPECVFSGDRSFHVYIICIIYIVNADILGEVDGKIWGILYPFKNAEIISSVTAWRNPTRQNVLLPIGLSRRNGEAE